MLAVLSSLCRRALLVAVALAASGAAAPVATPDWSPATRTVRGNACASRFARGRSGLEIQVGLLARRTTVAAVRAGATQTAAYGWPVKPFRRQHPIRAFFGDPRGRRGRAWSFHSGLDIAAKDGTPVYAVEAGKVYYNAPGSLGLRSLDETHAFGYWHIVPAVPDKVFVRHHQLLGHVAKGWGHVHFAERREDIYRNPLRPGALSPYFDHTAPAVAEIGVSTSRGALDLVAHAFDTTRPRVPGRWADKPVTPAHVRWRLTADRRPIARWETAWDVRSGKSTSTRFRSVYAPETRQNYVTRAGLFCFYLLRDWKPRRLRPGGYKLEVVASDTRGNRAWASARLTMSASR